MLERPLRADEPCVERIEEHDGANAIVGPGEHVSNRAVSRAPRGERDPGGSRAFAARLRRDFTLDGGDSVLTLAQWRSATGQDQQSKLIADATALAALFVDPAGGDYHLGNGSAALDAGESRPDLRFDLERSQRPQGLGWDAGAFEGSGVIFVDGVDAGSAVRWTVPLP